MRWKLRRKLHLKGPNKNVNRVVNIRGLETSKIPNVSGLSDKLVLGSIDLDKNREAELYWVLFSQIDQVP